MAGHRNQQPAYLPTKIEIAAACREIQSTWSPEEKINRRIAMPYERRGLMTPVEAYGEVVSREAFSDFIHGRDGHSQGQG
jgi:hypothetical protein